MVDRARITTHKCLLQSRAVWRAIGYHTLSALRAPMGVWQAPFCSRYQLRFVYRLEFSELPLVCFTQRCILRMARKHWHRAFDVIYLHHYFSERRKPAAAMESHVSAQRGIGRHVYL